MPSDSGVYTASYFDGRTAKKRSVSVALGRQGLTLNFPNKKSIACPYSSLSLAGGSSKKGPVRLHYVPREGEPKQVLVFEDPDIIHQIEKRDPDAFKSGLDRLMPPAAKRALILSAVVLVPLFLFFMWKGVLPAVTTSIAENIPTSWEEKLGEVALESFAGPKLNVPEEQTQKIIDAIQTRLLLTIPDQPYQFKIYVHSSRMVNAMALPGGTIVVFQGLLNRLESPEQLAGVLAHEFQHVLQRHATRNIIRQSAMGVLVSILTGDAEVLGLILESAGTLEGLAYGRSLETEADRMGMEMIQNAQIDSQGMIQAFLKLHEEEKKLLEMTSEASSNKSKESEEVSEEEGKMPQWLEWLSTHPAGASRVKLLKGMAKKAGYTPKPIMPDFNWSLVQKKKKPSKK